MPTNTLLSLRDQPSCSIKGIHSFEIKHGESWVILGGNGSGKSTFAKLLKASVPQLSAQVVSFEEEQRLLEREIYEDDSEFFDADPGRTTRELIEEHRAESVNADTLIDTLQLTEFINTGFRLLSTGERRRLMLARALSQNPDLLILDEPFDGLDIDFTAHMEKCVSELKMPTVLIVNRLSHISDNTTHLGYLHELDLLLSGERSLVEKDAVFKQLQNLSVATQSIPSVLPNTSIFESNSDQAIVDLRNIKVAYHNKTLLADLDWKIMPGQHWKVSGPNGCGKSTLVNLISGDHPQCYSNEMYLFGSKRGVGESIWDVKHFMGLMSTTLHQQYRITVTAGTVLLSGFFDTIGVYRPVSATHRKIADEWLKFLQLERHKNTNFKQLSFGQQRMLLIARALIKRPYLLILDEPCQGLDPINRALVIHLIEEIVAKKVAQVIYISHEPEDNLKCITHELRFTASDTSTTGYRIDLSASPAAHA